MQGALRLHGIYLPDWETINIRFSAVQRTLDRKSSIDCLQALLLRQGKTHTVQPKSRIVCTKFMPSLSIVHNSRHVEWFWLGNVSHLASVTVSRDRLQTINFLYRILCMLKRINLYYVLGFNHIYYLNFATYMVLDERI